MKIFSVLLLALTLSASAFSQCTPSIVWTTAGLPGLWPNATVGLDTLPQGTKGIAYNPLLGSTLTLIVPKDTTVDLSSFGLGTVTVTVNWMSISAVTGLPPGKTYACDYSLCTVPGDSAGCIKFSGTPDSSGTYTVTCSLSINVNVPVFGPQTLPASLPFDYTLLVQANVGIEDMNLNTFDIDQNTPNPFSEETTIQYHLIHAGEIQFEVFTLTGQRIHNEFIQGKSGLNQFLYSADHLSNGIYIYRILNNGRAVSRKMAVSR